DYLWSGLPMIVTEGDSMAELVAERKLGIVVPFEGVTEIASAIETIIDDGDAAEEMKRNIRTVSEEFRWERVMAPLLPMIAANAPDRSISPTELASLAGVYNYDLRNNRARYGLLATLRGVAGRIYRLTSLRMRREVRARRHH